MVKHRGRGDVPARGRWPRLTDATFRAFLDRLVGGEEAFFRRHWGRRALFVPGALRSVIGRYDEAHLLRDLARVRGHLVFRRRRGRLRETIAPDRDAALAEVERGGVLFVPLLRDDYARLRTPCFAWFRSFFDRARRYVNGHDVPGQSACTLFYGRDDASVGAHIDQAHAFTTVLFGRKRWEVDRASAPPGALRAAVEAVGAGTETPFVRKPQVFDLGPGDLLYVPPLTVHRVTTLEKCLSATIGIPAASEADVLHLMLAKRLRKLRLECEPLPLVPATRPGPHARATRTIHRRVGDLLDRIYRDLRGGDGD
jgi:ribosomal protein L16 Arg81 hydroxylase